MIYSFMSATYYPNPDQGLALIEPSIPIENDGLDNENFDLIVYHGSKIDFSDEFSFHFLQKLGSGQFGQVYRVEKFTFDNISNGFYAIKISKSTESSINNFLYEADALNYVCYIF